MALFPSKNSLRGNVLFIVLLGVVLFGALSYAVVNSNSDSGDTGSAEQARIYASEIVRYAQSMRATVDRMRMNGVSENDIRFAHPDLDVAYGTLGTTPKNEVFHPDGGGMSYLKPKEEWLLQSFKTESSYGNWIFNGRNQVAPEDCTDDSCPELIMLLPFLKKDVCQQINYILGVASEDTEPETENGVVSLALFNGTYSYSAKLNVLGGDSNYLLNYCFAGDTQPPSGSYNFYQILITR